PRPVRGRRLDTPRGAAAGARGARVRPEPGGRAHQQGTDRDPAEVRRPQARVPGRRGRADLHLAAGDRPGRGRAPLRAVDARRGGEAHRHLYPKATLPDGSQATVIAWIWARTVTCPNPACGIAMPLTSKWWLGK